MTIQKRLWISNLILIIITIILIIGVSLIITEHFQNFIGLPSPDNHMSPLNRAYYRAENTLINVIETEPERFLDQNYLQQIDDFINSLNIGLIVQKENEFVYFSTFINSLGLKKEDMSLNNYRIEPKSDNLTQISDNLFMKAIPFYFNDQSQGKIFLVYDSSSASQELNQFKKSVIYTLILFLIIIISINSLITYFLSKQIVNPLIRLKNAAQQIRKGN
ncbi:MAG: hypothetical protein PHX56_07140, partial [Atribacterota bacterium]|nr:hypothetical protein [Atribacterota bacterium]